MGLHERYARILGEQHLELAQKPSDAQQEELRRMFDKMMKALFKQDGATLDISILASKEGQDFINAHARTLDTSFKQVEMSDAMRRRLTRSNYIFSGLKTFHELHEAFPSLLDENCNRKPFERFLNDVRKIDKTYNENYLRSEYNFVHNSATMAAKWEQFMEDGDRYNLQYRTAGDDKVRPEHAALNGVTRPLNDSFWESYYPPNGWNCRCTVVQVRKTKYPETPHEEAMALGEEALQRDTKGMFRFNPGKERRSVPDYNPYTLRRCNDCDIAKGKTSLAFIPSNEVCEACVLVRQCYRNQEKSLTAKQRTHYLHEMEHLLQRTERKASDNGEIKVGFTKYGNKHLYSDTLARSRVLGADDLKDLHTLLARSEFIESSPLTHPRTDGIERFYYYKVQLRGQWIRLNVAKSVKKQGDGKYKISYFLYSINDIIKGTSDGI